MNGFTNKIELPEGEQQLEKLPKGAGTSLEGIGRLMMLLALIGGVIGAFAFGRDVSVSSFGRVSYEWNALSTSTIVVITGWSFLLSWAVYRLGTALSWLEKIGGKLDVE